MVRAPPVKDKSVVTATATMAPPTADANSDVPLTTTSSRLSNSLSSQTNESEESVVSLNTQQAVSNIRLTRERNRLTLRAYLHSLLESPVLASSPVLRHFLLSNPTRLSLDEQEDARRREEMDRKREEGRIRFARESASRVDHLRESMKSMKDDILAKGTTCHLFRVTVPLT